MTREKTREIAAGVHVVPGHVNLGLVRVGGGLLAIDSGPGEDSGRRLLAAAESLGAPLRWIFTTHGHADHGGGNDFLQRRTGAMILAPSGEVPFLEHPWLDPTSLMGGAPFRETAGRFLQARPCRVDIAVGPGPLFLPGSRLAETPGVPKLEVVPLRGHSADMAGLLVGDVLFAADSIFQADLIEHHRFIYHFHPRLHLATLERLAAMGDRRWVLGHGGLDGFDRRELLTVNRLHILATEAMVLEELDAAPLGREEIVAAFCRRLGVKVTPISWALVLGTVQGYLTGLRDEGVVEPAVERDRLAWRRVQ